MKKKGIILLGAIVILAALIGVYTVMKGKSDSAEAEEDKELLIDLTADKIQSIAWTPKDGDALSFSRVDGQWSLDSDKEFKVDQNAMNTVCSGVTGITVYQTMEDVTDLGQYGLDKPDYILKIKDSEGNETETAIGATNDSVNSLYVYKDGDKTKVYSVMASLKSAIEKNLTDLEMKDDSSAESMPGSSSGS